MTTKWEIPEFQRAASQTQARIREDFADAPDEVKPLLTFVDKHLFASDLSVAMVKRRCSVRGTAILKAFEAATGKTLGAYIRDRYLGAAELLLLHSDLQIWRIGEIFRYSSESAFSRAFRRWKGQRPSELRRSAGIGRVQRKRSDGAEFWVRSLAGCLDARSSRALGYRQQAIYGDASSQQAENKSLAKPLLRPDVMMERGFAKEVWGAIKHEPFAVQRATVLSSFVSPSLFHVLREQSLEEGRRDRQVGVWLAELAFEVLERCAPTLDEGTHDLKTLGWICISNARRLANDLPGAEEAIYRAEAGWNIPRSDPDPTVGAQILEFKSVLRLSQRRFDEALELENRAIERLRSLDEPRLLGRALVGRSVIVGYRGSSLDAIPDLREALSLLSEHDEPYLVFSAQDALAAIYALSGAYDQADVVLTTAKALCSRLAFEFGWLQLRWIEGLVKRGQGDPQAAESLLLDARDGFVTFGALDHVAVIALDLGILYVEQGRSAEAIELMVATLPMIKALDIYPEATAALALIRQAVEAEEMTLEVLGEARAHLEQLRRDPSVQISGA